MLGIGKVFGEIAGGFLDRLGLGQIAPFVKMGLNALTGNWMGVAKDVFDLVSGFRSNFLERASRQPPLGNFQSPSNTASPLSSGRLEEMLDLFGSLFGGRNQQRGLSRIFNALNIIKGTFDDFTRFDRRVTSSIFNNLKI